MATYNKKLESLTIEDIENISERFLRGWHDLSHYGFRLKGLNRKRLDLDLPELTRADSDAYRLSYVREHYSPDDIVLTLEEYMKTNRIDSTRWQGIELFDCRFGREYARLFKALVGPKVYRKLAESARISKLTETQLNLYGGVGLAGKQAMKKASKTVMERYGVTNAMRSKEITSKSISPFADVQVQRKAHVTRLMNKKAAKTQSSAELVIYEALVQRYGIDDVLYEYGVHPYDARYPYSCDFYIKSQDLFIEVNAHYSHGNHWYDALDHDDVLRVKHLLASDSHRSKAAVKTWTVDDAAKRAKAKRSGIKYLVFWDGSQSQKNGKRMPNVKDFKKWMYEYDADYEAFVRDNPNNTY